MSLFKRKKYVPLGNCDANKDLTERIKKLESLVEFLCHKDKDEIVLETSIAYTGYSYRVVKYEVSYISYNEIKKVSLGTYTDDITASITLNKKHMAIVRIGEIHLMIDKDRGTVADITELYAGGEEEADDENESKT